VATVAITGGRLRVSVQRLVPIDTIFEAAPVKDCRGFWRCDHLEWLQRKAEKIDEPWNP
jgi:hypothetical protein